MENPKYSNTYVKYVLGMLVIVYVFNFIDRQILAILAPSIKDDLGLSDTQIGALSGVAFGIFYATLGIPIARLADRYSRVNIISICLGIWSLMTALSGFAQNFVQLLIARIGVGIGEAGGSPPSHSLLADYFAPEKRATALGIYALGVPVGILFGNLAGGWINEFFGWRNAFFLVGIPGIVLAIILKMSVKEPPRGYSEGKPPEVNQVPFKEVLRTMWGYRSFRFIALGAGTQAFVGYGSIAWMPSFLVRTHDMSTGEVGTALGLIIGILGGAGTMLSGVIGDRLGARDKKWYMLVPAYAFLIAVPAGCAVYMVEGLWPALIIYMLPAFLVQLYTGPTFAMTQSLAPLAMRAAASALLLFIINIIGLVFGPTTVGILSDLLQSSMQMNDIESLRWALMLCNLVYLASFYYYFRASRTLEGDMNASQK
ncbi:MAG: MFS transporter [Pseudomonadales bacterium]|nr:MFS transporter [Pseudomonadales bacterium]MBO6565498.1 MFS transporter [Pseudomonadales bacterium]MBO6595427.1 MFS transporter [Pseudomonadales bacterium]MBO6657570.1 MFS transporter [Pseudomonadales bacterium]MBO6701927.1 MFS transporter [Pseudomonadales bacterium]